jgi:5-methylcytosine-specific restriction endonuclease McrA
VLDKNRKPLAPCHPARARKLLKKGRASVFRRYPFTIILHDRTVEESAVQPIEVKVDPGSKTTGIALVLYGRRGARVVWAAELHHRGHAIKKKLDRRRALRRGRRTRNLRYRPPRFDNRKRNGFDRWLPPSLQSRVDNLDTWVKRLLRYAPLTWAAVETARFDTQKMENPEINGVEYQQGTLAGYDVREYLLEKWGRRCVFCGAQGVPLQVEHLTPKSRGGSDRVHNLALACGRCNQDKGQQTAAEYGFPHMEDKARLPLRHAAIVNATRYAVGDVVKALLPTTFWSGSRTKFNRIRQGYPKTHWIDAACVGESGADVYLAGVRPLTIKAMGHGKRQKCRTDRYGFPIAHALAAKSYQGYKTGDLVEAVIPKGKYAGRHRGRVTIRHRPSFQLNGFNVHPKYLRRIQRADGYNYVNELEAV